MSHVAMLIAGFNLVCTGTAEYSGKWPANSDKPASYTSYLRIDTDMRSWCAASSATSGCSGEVRRYTGPEDGFLYLQSDDLAVDPQKPHSIERVNLDTGEHGMMRLVGFQTEAGYGLTLNGTCTKSAFTGLTR